MIAARMAIVLILISSLALGEPETQVGVLKKVTAADNREVSYPTRLAQVLRGSAAGSEVMRDLVLNGGDAVLTGAAHSYVSVLGGQTEAFLYSNTLVRFDAVNVWLMRRGSMFLVNKRGKLQVVIEGLDSLFVSSEVYLEATDGGLLLYVWEGNVTLGATASAVPLATVEAGRLVPRGTPQRSVLRPDEQARITKNISMARQVMSASGGPSPSPKGGGGAGAALVLLGLAAAGAGAYLLTRPKATETLADLVPQRDSRQSLCADGAAVIVTNMGSAAAPPSTTTVKFSGFPQVRRATAGVPPGGAVTLSLGGVVVSQCPKPPCNVTVVVDVDDQVTESNESNNTASGSCF